MMMNWMMQMTSSFSSSSPSSSSSWSRHAVTTSSRRCPRCRRPRRRWGSKTTSLPNLMKLLLLHAPIIIIIVIIISTISFVVVSAEECGAMDENNAPVSLYNLPEGVFYYNNTDRFHCKTQSSCRGWTISHCSHVECVGSHSCEDATFMNNDAVNCRNFAACQDAHMYRSHEATCGWDAINACGRATIQSDTMVTCKGPYACSSDFEDRIFFRMGRTGVVWCVGQGSVACQHIDVQVSHAHRACIVNHLVPPGKHGSQCAVICGPEDCETSTIRFLIEF